MKRTAVVFCVLLLTATAAHAQLTNDQKNKLSSFENWAILAWSDIPNIAKGRHEAGYYKGCIHWYDEMIKAGVSPTQRVEERDTVHGRWSGAVEALRDKYCIEPLKQATAKTADSEAPYRAVLRNDKLKMVIASPPGHIRTYAVPGGEYSTDQKKLAAASVWFDNASAPSNEIQVCRTGGKRITLRRYAFDAQHKLVSHTSQEFCGSIPSSAYR